MTETAPAPQRSRMRRALGHPLAHLLAAFLVLALLQGFVVKLFMVPSGSMEHTLEVGDRILVNRLAFGPLNDSGPETGQVLVFHTDDELWPRSAAPESNGFIALAKHSVKWVLGDLLGIGPTTSNTMVKRVIAGAGQTVSCCDAEGRLLVDGEPLDEPYIFEDLPFEAGSFDCESSSVSQRCFSPVTVPEGKLLMLGDHRGASSDGITPCRGTSDAYPSDESCVRWVNEDDVIGEVFTIIWPLGRFGGLGPA